jgi:hypothetical protein
MWVAQLSLAELVILTVLSEVVRYIHSILLKVYHSGDKIMQDQMPC